MYVYCCPGGPGSRLKGISLLLIERGPGVRTTKIKTAYSPSAGTALVIFGMYIYRYIDIHVFK